MACVVSSAVHERVVPRMLSHSLRRCHERLSCFLCGSHIQLSWRLHSWPMPGELPPKCYWLLLVNHGMLLMRMCQACRTPLTFS